MVEKLWDGMFGQIFAVLSERTKLTEQEGDDHARSPHDLHCIERGDAIGAHAAMTNHLVHVEMKLLKSEADGAPHAARTLERRTSRVRGRLKPARVATRSRNRNPSVGVPTG